MNPTSPENFFPCSLPPLPLPSSSSLHPPYVFHSSFLPHSSHLPHLLFPLLHSFSFFFSLSILTLLSRAPAHPPTSVQQGRGEAAAGGILPYEPEVTRGTHPGPRAAPQSPHHTAVPKVRGGGGVEVGGGCSRCQSHILLLLLLILLRIEQQRREEVGRVKMRVKVLFNNQEVSQTKDG